MQASTATPLSLHSQDAHHAQESASEYMLKRQFLALLPPQQIIEICLIFEIHAPVYVKSSVWPPDFNAAIAAMQAHTLEYPVVNELPSKSPNEGDHIPVMDSLLADSSQPPPATTPPEQSSAENPDSEQRPSTPAPPSPPSHSEAPANLQPSQPAHQPQPPYAYPHAPYYPPPHPGYPSYPYHTYPPPPTTHSPPPPGYHLSANGILVPNNPSLAHPPQPQDPFNNAPPEVPSYEEMLVEAINDSGDPEGCAPKDLFAWMASHYPLQSNFRPSASQALQKAFKRGRLEKSSEGKYRMNAAWEGGNTSRRTTRRPQTYTKSAHTNQNQQTTMSSPFTHAPLVHHEPPPAVASTSGHPSHPGTSFGYPYPPSGYPGYPPPTVSNETEENAAEERGIAWEAAQNILKAINFGRLLQLPVEKSIDPTPDAAADGKPANPSLGVSLASTNEVDKATATKATGDVDRAGLQVHLALLAAQLAETAQARENVGSTVEGMETDVMDEDDEMEEVPMSVRSF